MASSIRLVGGALRELRIHLCQSSEASKGVRDFLRQDYPSLKQSNPSFPVLIRECSGIQPRVWARFSHGQEKSVSLENHSKEQVGQVLRDLSALKPGN